VSADLLREAALKMRARAEAATGATRHWTSVPAGVGVSRVFCGQVLIAKTDETLGGSGFNAQHIASWHPAVALAVADWLIKSAETYERLEDDLRGLEGVPTIEQVYGYDFTEAIAVARAYVGADA